MKQINLYQAAFHPPRIILPTRRLLAGGALFLCGLLAVYAWETWRLAQLRQDVGALTQRAADLEQRINNSSSARQIDPHVQAETASMEARLRGLQLAQEALASGALGSETGYSAQFRALSRARVAGAWLTRVAIGERGHEMSLRGRALTGEDNARLIANLHREPLFVGLSFAGLTVAPPEDKSQATESTLKSDARLPPRFLEFTLNAHLKPSAPAANAPAAGTKDTP